MDNKLLNIKSFKTIYSALLTKVEGLINKSNSMLTDKIDVLADDIERLDFKSDWNQNDETAKDYIKNRPFYDNTIEVVLVDNLTSEDYSNGEIPKCNFIPGDIYKVIWNGEVYDNLTCYFNGEYNIIASTDNGYPFYIDDDGGDALYISSDNEDEAFIVSIITLMGEIHKIDEKYLPDSVMESEVVVVTRKADDRSMATHSAHDIYDLSNEGRPVIFVDSDMTYHLTYSEVDPAVESTFISIWQNYIYAIKVFGDGSIAKEKVEIGNAEDIDLKMDKENPVGTGSFSMNRKVNTVIGNCSHAEGNNTTASGGSSHSEGYSTEASGYYSHAEGFYTIAHGNMQHVQGKYNKIEYFTKVNKIETNTNVKAYGYEATVRSIDEQNGYIILDSLATSATSAANVQINKYYITDISKVKTVKINGVDTKVCDVITFVNAKTSQSGGHYKIINDEITVSRDKYAHIVGNGTGTNASARSNAHTLDWEGNAWFQGDVYVGSTSGTNKDEGSKKLATVEDVANALGDVDLSSVYTKTEVDNAITNAKNDLLNGAGAAYDTLKELGDLIDNNTNALEALETVATNKADKIYVDEAIENINLDTYEFITVADIDEICGADIVAASEVTY